MDHADPELRRAYRLLPTERAVWLGRPRTDVPRPRRWRLMPAGLVATAAIAGSFSALLRVTELPGAGRLSAFAALLLAFAGAVTLVPSFLLDPCEFLLTDRRALWRRGRIVRSLDLSGLSYARIRWHRSVRGLGSLELVRAVPFGPLARRQRIVFHDVPQPDRLLATIRGAEPSPGVGDDELTLAQRLDEGERVLWGGHPDGFLLGVPELATAAAGVFFLFFALRYAHVVGGILLGLEDAGLSVHTWTWTWFFLATAVSFAVFAGLGAGLLWFGWWRARALGRKTEYLLTDRRLMIRRGRTELSVDRDRIVDIADAPGTRGSRNLFLVLDDPESRALATSGALARFPPPRDSVPPVLYELRDPSAITEALASRGPDLEAA